jgi:hypothetical protein
VARQRSYASAAQQFAGLTGDASGLCGMRIYGELYGLQASPADGGMGPVWLKGMLRGGIHCYDALPEQKQQPEQVLKQTVRSVHDLENSPINGIDFHGSLTTVSCSHRKIRLY